MNNRIYISGPITGVKGWERVFAAAEATCESVAFFDRHGGFYLYYKSRRFGFEAVSPREFNAGVRYKRYKRWWLNMMRSYFFLIGCSYVYMLRGWHESRGARREHTLATLLGKEIIYEEDGR